MAGIGLLDHVRREGTDCVDAFELEGGAFVGLELGGLVIGVHFLRGGLHFLLFNGVYHSLQCRSEVERYFRVVCRNAI